MLPPDDGQPEGNPGHAWRLGACRRTRRETPAVEHAFEAGAILEGDRRHDRTAAATATTPALSGARSGGQLLSRGGGAGWLLRGRERRRRACRSNRQYDSHNPFHQFSLDPSGMRGASPGGVAAPFYYVARSFVSCCLRPDYHFDA